ncbi:hypothetical protein J7M23_09625 [Candidatus Sumerlaeota bacterium]|nr:hypothetical protein [Candidatus Sumerlaeota bacterium]
MNRRLNRSWFLLGGLAVFLSLGMTAWALLFSHNAKINIPAENSSAYAIYRAQGIVRSIVYTAPVTATLNIKDEPSGATYYSSSLTSGTHIVTGLSLYTAGQTRLQIDLPTTYTQTQTFTLKVVEER